ncbi:MAG: VOC family protein [Candidatus Marinimicrobia bacterium]|nr:VOC family protein [Candidatus Neomarinimicrobiota bacterium]
MLDHIIITVSDYDASKAFYLKALKPLGYSIVMEFGKAGGFGIAGKPDFWIRQADAVKPAVHIAFASQDRPTVAAFYAAAIDAGGVDNGGPGLRPDYHPNYYGAFVFDPDGNNIEAVCHKAV